MSQQKNAQGKPVFGGRGTHHVHRDAPPPPPAEKPAEELKASLKKQNGRGKKPADDAA